VAAYEESGRTKALPLGGNRRSVLIPCRDWLLSLRRAQNDLTLDQLRARLLAERGVKADKSMLSRFFAAEGISFKKNRSRQRAGARGRGRSAHRLEEGAA
jgi:transposase